MSVWAFVPNINAAGLTDEELRTHYHRKIDMGVRTWSEYVERLAKAYDESVGQ